MGWKRVVGTAALLAALLPQTVMASGGVALPYVEWSFSGAFGRFDQAALRRGAQVAAEVCMSCHSFKYIKFDQFREFGMTEAEIKTLAESQGKNKSDKMISGMDPETGKESFGTAPPDLSLMTKARKGYENYAYAILTGYLSDEDSALITKVNADGATSEAEIKELASALHLNPDHPEQIANVLKRIANGENFNKYFPGNFFAMPQPMFKGQVQYRDGTKDNSLEQMSKDLVTFMAWAAEPKAQERKQTGSGVLLYLVVLTAMLYAVKRRIWAKVHH